MRNAAHFRRVFTPLSAFIAFAAMATPIHAVTMQVTAGFDGVAKSPHWTPVAVQLANPSEDDIEGVLVVSEPEGLTTPMPVCTAQVNLPANSTKLYHAYVRLPGYASKIRVALTRGYGVLAAREARITAAGGEDKLIVTVGERAARLSFMQGETVVAAPQRASGYGAPSGPSQANINAGSLSPKMLPDRPAAYEGADVIVISGLSPESTDPDALKAICAWTASGGTLVVSTGPDYRAYTNTFYDEILPVRIVGATNVSGMTALSTIGGEAFPPGPAAIAASTIKPGIGRAVLSEGGMPLIAERRYGAGKVVFLAFDTKAAPFRDWNGQSRFWKGWISDTSAGPIVPTETRFAGDAFYGSYPGSYQPYGGHDSGLASVVMQTPSIKTPSISAVGLFLVAYLVILVPVNYAVLRARRRLELAWLTMPAIVLLFTVGAYAIGYTMKGGSLRLCEATLIQGSSNARFARAVTNASIFSPARRSYSISVADPSAISQVVPMSREDEPPITFLAETSAMDDVAMAMWSSKTFEAVGGMDLGGVIESNLKVDGGKLVGEVRNNTALDLRDCKVAFGGASTSIAHLAKGGVLRVELKPSPGSPQGGPSNYYGEARAIERLKAFADSSAVGSGPVLIGFVDTKGVFDVADGRAQADRAVCCVFDLDYDRGNTISIAPAMVVARPVYSNSGGPRAQNPAGPGMISCNLYGGESVTGIYRLPLPAGFRVTSLKIIGSVNRNGNPSASNGQVSVSIYNYTTGKPDAISIPSGASLPSPANYVSPGGEVKVKFQNANSSTEISCGVSAEAKRL